MMPSYKIFFESLKYDKCVSSYLEQELKAATTEKPPCISEPNLTYSYNKKTIFFNSIQFSIHFSYSCGKGTVCNSVLFCSDSVYVKRIKKECFFFLNRPMFIIRNLIKTKQGSFPFALSNLLKCGTNSMFGNCLSLLPTKIKIFVLL